MEMTTGIATQFRRAAELAELRLRRTRLLEQVGNDPLVDLKQTRAMLAMGDTMARSWIKAGKLPVVRIGRRYFCRLSTIRKIRGEL